MSSCGAARGKSVRPTRTITRTRKPFTLVDVAVVQFILRGASAQLALQLVLCHLVLQLLRDILLGSCKTGSRQQLQQRGSGPTVAVLL